MERYLDKRAGAADLGCDPYVLSRRRRTDTVAHEVELNGRKWWLQQGRHAFIRPTFPTLHLNAHDVRTLPPSLHPHTMKRLGTVCMTQAPAWYLTTACIIISISTPPQNLEFVRTMPLQLEWPTSLAGENTNQGSGKHSKAWIRPKDKSSARMEKLYLDTSGEPPQCILLEFRCDSLTPFVFSSHLRCLHSKPHSHFRHFRHFPHDLTACYVAAKMCHAEWIAQLPKHLEPYAVEAPFGLIFTLTLHPRPNLSVDLSDIQPTHGDVFVAEHPNVSCPTLFNPSPRALLL